MLRCLRAGFNIAPDIKIAIILQRDDQRDKIAVFSEISAENLHDIAGDTLRDSATQERAAELAIQNAMRGKIGG